MAQRFFIAPYEKNSGLQTNVEPWLISDLAFSTLENAYVWRGRVKKRFGSRWLDNDPLLSRFRVSVGTTDGNGDLSGTTPGGGAPIVTPAIGQMFSCGNEVFTVVATGTPANMLISGAATVATFNTTTGAFVINGAAATTIVYYYPNLPVMGLLTYELDTVSYERTIGFDTRFAYQYTAGAGWNRISAEATAGAAQWAGTDSQFFWAANWTGTNAFDKFFYVTNFDATDTNSMRYYNGTNWNVFRPAVNGTENLNGARLLIPFQNRLVAFNTWEGAAIPGNNYPNRIRFSAEGDPTAANAWNDTIPGQGSGLDAPVNEAIITAEFLRNRLIVYFERSTWELVYTGNQVDPFRWQQLNTELGAESTFSVVPFDKAVLGVGNIGIHACNGVNVERIDNSIPDTAFNIQNDFQGPERVYGIRDYFTEMVLWAYPDTESTANQAYPTRVLAYNYKNDTWAKFDDSITAFGYFQPETGVTWDSEIVTWDDAEPWSSTDIQNRSRQIIAGNQQGYTFIFESDTFRNAEVLQITNIVATPATVTITCINHNLRYGEYIYIDGVTGGTLTLLNNNNFYVSGITDANTFTIANDVGAAGTYTGAGRISRVSKITAATKEFNFFLEQGVNNYVSYVDFLVTTTNSAQYEVNFYVSTSLRNYRADGAGNNVLLGTGTLDTYPYDTAAAPIPAEAEAARVWHPVYFQADGEFIQLEITSNPEQMMDVDMQQEDFEIHAMCVNAEPTSSRFQ